MGHTVDSDVTLRVLAIPDPGNLAHERGRTGYVKLARTELVAVFDAAVQTKHLLEGIDRSRWAVLDGAIRVRAAPVAEAHEFTVACVSTFVKIGRADDNWSVAGAHTAASTDGHRDDRFFWTKDGVESLPG